MEPSHKSTVKRTTRTKKVIENYTMKGLEVKIQLKEDIKIMQQKRRSVPFLLQQSVEKKTKNEKTMSLRKVQKHRRQQLCKPARYHSKEALLTHVKTIGITVKRKAPIPNMEQLNSIN